MGDDNEGDDNEGSGGGGRDVENQKELERSEEDFNGNAEKVAIVAATSTTPSKDYVSMAKDDHHAHGEKDVIVASTGTSTSSKDSVAKDDHHAHDDEEPTTASLVSSAVVCFVIYFVFCIVFSSVVWDPLAFASSTDPTFGVPQGVGINLLGIAIGCVAFAAKSGSKAVMAGPDLIPVVFFAQAGASVVAYLSSISSDPYAGCSDVASSHRNLGGEGYGDSPDPCAHRHLAGDEMYLDNLHFGLVVQVHLVPRQMTVRAWVGRVAVSLSSQDPVARSNIAAPCVRVGRDRAQIRYDTRACLGKKNNRDEVGPGHHGLRAALDRERDASDGYPE